MTLALMGWSNVWAYDSATEGTSYKNWWGEAVGLSDGTVQLKQCNAAAVSGNTITFPATFQIFSGSDVTAEYKVSEVGNGYAFYINSVSSYQYSGDVTSLVFADGIKTINASAFYEMTSLQSIELPASLTTIGNYAFTSCDALTSIICYATTAPTLGTDALKGKADWNTIAANCVLKVPDGCALTYAANSGGGSGSWTYYDEFYKNNKIHELTYPSITTAGWGTYYNTYGYVMPKGVEGWLVNWTYDGKANLVKVYNPGDEVVASIALLWKSTEDLSEETWYTVEALSSGGATAAWPVDGESNAYNNLLCGSQTSAQATAWGAESSDYYYYKLSYDNSGNNLGWYWAENDGATFTSGAHKAWLVVSKSAGVKAFIPLFGDDPTGIESIQNSRFKIQNEVYDLQGRKIVNCKSLNSKSSRGIYIQDGKKFINK